MKKIIFTFAAISCIFFSCHKNEEMFAGSSSLKGSIFYVNPITETDDTALSATLRIRNSDSLYYEPKVKKGTFEVNLLRKGEYTVTGSYIQVIGSGNEPLIYHLDTMYKLSEGEQYLANPVYKWSNNTTALKIQFVDSTAARNPIANASVFLYNSYSIMMADTGFSGIGTIRSSITNQKGIILFSGLQNRMYYVKAKIDLGPLHMRIDTNTSTLPLNIMTSETIILN